MIIIGFVNINRFSILSLKLKDINRILQKSVLIFSNKSSVVRKNGINQEHNTEGSIVVATITIYLPLYEGKLKQSNVGQYSKFKLGCYSQNN